jgi:hypothetical protein
MPTPELILARLHTALAGAPGKPGASLLEVAHQLHADELRELSTQIQKLSGEWQVLQIDPSGIYFAIRGETFAAFDRDHSEIFSSEDPRPVIDVAAGYKLSLAYDKDPYRDDYCSHAQPES